MIQLSIGSLLQEGKYKIEKVLGQGGFGITYLAEHTLLGKKVAIKEFFYKDYCNRDNSTSHITLGTQGNKDLVERFLKKFIKEAQTISQFHHPNIVEIYDIFNENNTAYYVMEYIEGSSLNDLVKKHGKLPETTAITYINKVADALKCVHSHHINHLDVKPSNIMLRESDNEIILIDFGTSKQYDIETNVASTTNTPVGISAGFAPIEQYRMGGVSSFSPESDIYALGATLYKLLTGITPPESIALGDEGLANLEFISPNYRKVILHCMKVRKSERPHSLDEFINLLTTASSNSSSIYERTEDDSTKVLGGNETDDNQVVEKTTSIDENVEQIKEKSTNRTKYIAFGFCLVLLVLGFIVFGGETDENLNRTENITTTKQVNNQSATSVQNSDTKMSNSNNSSTRKANDAKLNEVKNDEILKEDNVQLLQKALDNDDFQTIQKLANQGFAPAYVPLAKYYLDNNEYDSAAKYAQKGKNAGQSGAQSIITVLKNLGYYD